ncbi:hypothetical protein ACFXQA_03985 [Microbacterium sp. P07]|uniref:hypothetical protein n=1 Tax=Microbacterium sp. P07 TaxID=3366952 RepID=UPI0037476149
MRRLAAVGALAALLAVAGVGAAVPAAAAPGDVIVVVPDSTTGPTPTPGGTAIDDAQLRWGLSAEAGGGAFFGGCNFLSAGRAGDAGSGRVWGADDGLYRPQDGAVRIEKPASNGEWVAASFASRCLDPQGREVSSASTTSTSGNQVVIDGGVGTVDSGGATRIEWSGSFTVAFYGGLTYWSVTNPVLTIDESGSGRLVGTASGYGTDMDDLSAWEQLPERSIVLAEVRRVDTSAGVGFAVVPEYLGVAVTTGDTPQTRTGSFWGSFPQSFVDYQQLTGQNSYWYSSGGARDAAKPATTLYVSYDAAAPVAVPPPGSGAPATGSGSGAAPSNPVRMPPGLPAPNAVPSVPTAATVGVSASAAVTTLPAAKGLVPAMVAALSPLVVPLLGTAAALGLSIVAVLSLMQALPWQRRRGMS